MHACSGSARMQGLCMACRMRGQHSHASGSTGMQVAALACKWERFTPAATSVPHPQAARCSTSTTTRTRPLRSSSSGQVRPRACGWGLRADAGSAHQRVCSALYAQLAPTTPKYQAPLLPPAHPLTAPPTQPTDRQLRRRPTRWPSTERSLTATRSGCGDPTTTTQLQVGAGLGLGFVGCVGIAGAFSHARCKKTTQIHLKLKSRVAFLSPALVASINGGAPPP